MKQIKFLLNIFFFLVYFVNYGQTFSLSDSFSQKKSKTIETQNSIIKLINSKGKENFIISGKLLDKETKSPIPNATISENNKSNSATTTDFNGNFTIESASETPELKISNLGNDSEIVNTDSSKDEETSLTSLSGLLVANLGDESVVQPNIMLSQGWKISSRSAIELRVLGFQKNKDTIQLTNGLNLIKPEISKIDLRITGDFIPFKNIEAFSLNTELNLYKQQLNKVDTSSQNIQGKDITSLLWKLTAGYNPTNGLHFYASGVYYNVFEGVENYEKRFGESAIKQFWNCELSGKFVFKDGMMKGTFVQAALNINSNNYKELLNTKDSGVFLLRIGFDKTLIRD